MTQGEVESENMRKCKRKREVKATEGREENENEKLDRGKTEDETNEEV